MRGRLLAVAALAWAVSAYASPGSVAGIDWVKLPGFEIARTETTIGQFRSFVAATGLVTLAEREGGGSVYEAGWTRKPGWIWSAPYGPGHQARDDEPVAHVTYGEAQAFCRWAQGRLPTDLEWLRAAHVESRTDPPAPFVAGRQFPYPTGERPLGAHCLGDCGQDYERRAVSHGVDLARGRGHARVGQTPAGVNGLYDMGANLWEWVDEPRGEPQPGSPAAREKRTRGGSWWYGAAQMRADHLQGKPPDTAVVYIGFRCVRP